MTRPECRVELRMATETVAPNAPSTPSLSTDTTRLLVDPLNRYYRYPWLEKVALLMKDSRVHPNHLTVLHTLVGVFAAYLIFAEHYVFAVVAYEVRNILDALGGRLVRAQKRSTARGRALEMIGDGVTFNALMIVGAFRLIQDFRNYNPVLIVSSVFIFAFITAHCGTVYQLMKRKLGSIINKEIDQVETEWREEYELVKSGKGGFLVKFGFWLNSVTIRFVSSEWYKKVYKRRDDANWKDRAIRDAELMNELACITRKQEFKRAVRVTAFVSEDNIFAVLSCSFLVLSIFPDQIFPHVHPVLIAFSLGLAYGVVALLLGLYFLQDFLHGVYHEDL